MKQLRRIALTPYALALTLAELFLDPAKFLDPTAERGRLANTPREMSFSGSLCEPDDEKSG